MSKEEAKIWEIWWVKDSSLEKYKNQKEQRPVLIIKKGIKNTYHVLKITTNDENKWFYYNLKSPITKNKLVSKVQMNQTFQINPEDLICFARSLTSEEKNEIILWNNNTPSNKVALYLLALEEKKQTEILFKKSDILKNTGILIVKWN